MKTQLVRVSMLVLGAAAAWGQYPIALKANVPFDFTVSGVSMPAGTYLVTPLSSGGFLTLRAEAGGRRVAIPTIAAETLVAPTAGKLVFRRYGDQYFLAETWMQGSTFGRRIPPSKQERLLAGGPTIPSRAVIASAK